MSVYYNEIDPFCVAVLRECIKRGVISDGIVDDRSIEEVDPKDLREFKWVHFFAGGGFWDIAARRAGYPTDETLWTGSCPCQPFSNAGKRAELPIQGIYGPTFTDLLPPPNQVSSLVNRLVLNLGMIGSTESPLTWKVKTTNAKRSIYRLVPSTRPTRETDYTGSLDYWGTPMKGFGDGGFRPDGKYGMSFCQIK